MPTFLGQPQYAVGSTQTVTGVALFMRTHHHHRWRLPQAAATVTAHDFGRLLEEALTSLAGSRICATIELTMAQFATAGFLAVLQQAQANTTMKLTVCLIEHPGRPVSTSTLQAWAQAYHDAGIALCLQVGPTASLPNLHTVLLPYSDVWVFDVTPKRTFTPQDDQLRLWYHRAQAQNKHFVINGITTAKQHAHCEALPNAWRQGDYLCTPLPMATTQAGPKGA